MERRAPVKDRSLKLIIDQRPWNQTLRSYKGVFCTPRKFSPRIPRLFTPCIDPGPGVPPCPNSLEPH